ncbi:tRNA (adenosine(37)-N6)-threonylcarbamoyltransferase complex transferase subunit TsaD [Candidatus Collierbacteria bacterium RIFCSPLOWO2_01_FULL_50_23]|uniref:tRNA N6-adenosine threonylcarbamoyltransferase n=1 Tax=Candidatus Collierbacteria bacterium RIFCSPHIGHO2_01_FULL_50_25 TaxID=1817722 RepID=A0A1F5EUL6_9BACT|nr:MAG: tRNA (adenosine(37)-N6)-threonylcarbamoyltransferase complex transferase subunit TsaD [Candidatus Collierbacteria bacterium RIFCSPHIGHO2_01_FULL_50_25]OGD74696.1 MAG: tRNA (adenosine(37)-N6)-threonylcarbamoyltransferase complex transferase subunit TsaD [Candidatus Collierbacteria bacterium RIFCSPLOWO2_01_FULL_50_23]
MIVLAIESTCDETGASVARRSPMVEGDVIQAGVEILSDVKASSAEILSKYGGIVPEVAAREQVAAIIPVIEEAIEKSQIAINQIDAIAVTEGPGLIGSLLIGVETAKALALAWKKPLIRVNHMAAHLFANWIVRKDDTAPEESLRAISGVSNSTPELPAVALIVSGGHTDLILLRSLTDWEWVGGTRDDAAGEAFDKAARAMDFPYPGGPMVAKAAAEAELELPVELKLPRPMIHENNLEMSFSGLKTALIDVMKENKEKLGREPGLIKSLAREFNQAVAEVLIKKTMLAIERFSPKAVLLAGGVAANTTLREGLAAGVKKVGLEFYLPDLKYCTDNAAMIAACALMRPTYIDPLKLRPNPGLEVG